MTEVITENPRQKYFCIDDYFCTSEKSALLRHLLLGPLSLVMLLFALFTNILIASVLGNQHLRSEANPYLTTAILSDSFRCIVFIIGVVMPSMTYQQKGQINLYESIVAFLVPIGEPLGHLLNLITAISLICACVIRLRSIHAHSKPTYNQILENDVVVSNTRRLHLMAMLIFVCIISAPTFIRFKIVETMKTNLRVRVFYTYPFKNHNEPYVIWNIYDTILLALSTIILLILIISLMVITSKRKMKYNPKLKHRARSFTSMIEEEAQEPTKPIYTHGKSVLKRIKMEIIILYTFGMLWIVPAFTYMIYKLVIVIKNVPNNEKVYEQLLVITIISQFAQTLFLFIRSLSVLFGGVYIRRIIMNMLKMCVKPSEYQYAMNKGDLVLLSKMRPDSKHNLEQHANLCLQSSRKFSPWSQNYRANDSVISSESFSQ